LSVSFLNAEALVRKRILLLPLFVAALLTTTATAAQAGIITLILDDENLGVTAEQTFTVPDNPAVNPDPISFVGTVGQFNVTFAANLSNPSSVAPLSMKFTNFQVSTQSAGNFRATLLGTDLYSSALGTSVVSRGAATVTITGTAGNNATFYNSIDGTTVYSRSFPGAIPPAVSSALLVGSQLDLVSVWDFNFVGSGNMMGSSELRVSDAPVPEPTTLLLFGPGMVGLAALRRRRRLKTIDM
jgi:hypothetical protein